MRRIAPVLLALSLASLPGCKKKSGTGTGGGSSWLVGRAGTMLRFDLDTHSVEDYPLDADVDLADIACRGTDEAWVVGQRGTLFRTGDGGESWEAVELPTTADLTSVAAAGLVRVWAAGDGVALTSDDAGASWTLIPTPAVEFTSITTDYTGAVALATSADGAIYRLGATATQVHAGVAPLRSIATSADGVFAIAVGDDGTALRSSDGGRSFAPLATGVDAALHAVQLSQDGAVAVAVGDGGTIVRVTDGVTVQALLSDDLALRALHLSQSGMGLAVGDDGTALASHDGGLSWAQVDLGVTVDLTGVDDLHGEPHL